MVKNITFTADERLIQRARTKAVAHHQTLNEIFRQWLKYYVSNNNSEEEYATLMKKLSYAKPGKHFTRDEMNER
jgi:hypothetical protein